jgi:tRNA (cytidine/uridine-2'-O-)-methyltransferase
VHIVLVEPEIPQNTGNVARTCAALGADLHLVHPLGFSVDERAVRRAGLDYWHLVEVHEHASLASFLDSLAPDEQVVLYTSRSSLAYTDVDYDPDAYLVFGRETTGLPDHLVDGHRGPVVRIPTVAEARCLNLSNAVAVGAYEAARQNAFAGLVVSPATGSPSATSQDG